MARLRLIAALWIGGVPFLLADPSSPLSSTPPGPEPVAPALSVPAPASASTTPDAIVPGTDLQVLDDKKPLQVGEQFLFRVVEDRDPSVSLSVMESGDALFPYIGRVKVAGKTCKEIAALLKPLLEKDYYYRATVFIALNETSLGARGSVFVSGEVNKPGTIQIPKERRLLASEAIIAAGGFQQFADERKVRVIRKKIGATNGKATEELIVDVKAVLDEGKVAKDLELQAEDRVVVRAKLVNF
ncbi:MAG: SLBB domain-containing protein [Candidatus Methylacidiphilales bacterium]|nr:SLBB domain-containing protein [Candidatus Methylacidiphilales bacterium]